MILATFTGRGRAVHQTDQGLDHVTVGLAGVVWGMSGMNADGVVWTANLSDTLEPDFDLDLFFETGSLTTEYWPEGRAR